MSTDFQLDLTDDEEDGGGGGGVDETSYRDEVDEQEIDRFIDSSRRRIRQLDEPLPPTLSDMDRADRLRRKELGAERSRLRERGGMLREVDENGVRGDQRRPTVTPEQAVLLAEEGKQGLLRPFRREGGIDLSAPTMTTSWVDNVAFDATIVSDTEPIRLYDVRAKNFVASSDSPITSMLQDNGIQRELGQQYAVFSYALRRSDALVHAHPKLVLSVDLVATFDGVVRDVSALNLFTLDFARVHPILIDNASLGKTVPIRRPGVTVFKEAKSLEDAPRATINGANYRYTLRFDPRETQRKWMLTHVDFWLKRSHLMDRRDDEQNIYWRAEIDVNDTLVDPLRVEVFAVEDPGSNPLDPLLRLIVKPNRDRRSGLGLPLRRDESIEIRMFAATKLVARERDETTQRVKETRWTELVELGVSEDNTNDLLRRVVGRFGAADLTVFRDRTPRETDKDERSFTSNTRGLRNSSIEWRFVNDFDERGDSLFTIDSIVLGPFRVSSVYEAILDQRSRLRE